MYYKMYNIYCGPMVYVTIKKLGNSLGVLLPVEYIRRNRLSENEVVEIEIQRKNMTIKELYGTLKRKKSGQQIKDELRAGWGE